jgi:hypothetical protein
MSDAEHFDAMLAASSLGSEQARAIRGQAPPAAREHARRVLNGEEATVSGSEDPVGGGEEVRMLLSRYGRERSYQDAFAAIMTGRNAVAARVLHDLTPEQLAELHVICRDVQTMVEAAMYRRDPAERFAAACARVDADPRERQRIADIASLTDAETIIYREAVAASARGDKDAALKLLRWCAPLGIGESAWLLAVALEDAGRLLEAIPWYSRAASDGDERAAIRLARAVGPEGEK